MSNVPSFVTTNPRSWWPIGCLLVLLLLLMIAVAVWLNQPSEPVMVWNNVSSQSAMALSPDGQILAFGTIDPGGITLLQLRDNTVLRTIRDWSQARMAFSPDGQFLATGGEDGIVKVWQVANGTLLYAVHAWSVPKNRHMYVDSITFSPDGHFLAASGADVIGVWDVATGRLIYIQPGEPEYYVWSLAFSPDSTLLAAGGRRVRLLAAADGQLVRQFTGGARTVAFSPDGQHLLITGTERAELRQVRDGALIWEHESRWHAYRAIFSPDGRYIAVADGMPGGGLFIGLSFPPTRRVALWRASNGQTVQTFRGHSEGAFGLAFAPDGTALFSKGGMDEMIKRWRITPSAYLWFYAWLGLCALGGVLGVIWIWRTRPR